MPTYRVKEPPVDYTDKKDYISATQLCAKTPLHFKYSRLPEEKKPKEWVRITKKKKKDYNKPMGRALHSLVLQPSKFKDHFAYLNRKNMPYPNDTLRNKKNKEYSVNWEKESFGKTILEYDEYNRVIAMRNAVYNSPRMSKLLDSGYIENNWYSDENEWGIKNKVRIDFVSNDPKRSYLLDLKMVSDANPDVVINNIFKSGKHVALGNYLWSVNNDPKRTVEEYRRFVIVAVEYYPPFAVSVINIDEFALEYAKICFEARMKTLQKCFKTGHFPSYEIFSDNKFNLTNIGIKNYMIKDDVIW